jgi:hypothetical protein
VASGLPKIKRTHFSSFPCALEKGKRKTEVMRVLKQILLTAGLVIGIAISASAQSGGDQPKKPPQKPPPPVIKVPDKPPPKPREDKSKGKPGMEFAIVKRESDSELV